MSLHIYIHQLNVFMVFPLFTGLAFINATLGQGLETVDYNIGLRNNNTTSAVPKVSTKVEQQQPRHSDKHWDREAEMRCECD